MEDVLLFFICGFLASLVDGCIGMAYGILSTTLLTFLGFPILVASSTIHFCEVFTSFASGISHLVNGNVSKFLLKYIMISGVFGGVLGALSLVILRDFNLKPFVAIYLLFIGIVILKKVLQKDNDERKNRSLIPLGFFGGFFDAVGGGGWGPIVSGTLIARGHVPAKVVGTVNLAEFFVTLAQVIIFFTFVSFVQWKMALGFILGGCIAAPLSAILVKRINPRVLMILVASGIIFLNLLVLIKTLWKG